jgi:hypothetical protein
MVYKYAQSSDINNIRFWIKPHPSIQEKILKKWWGKEWPEEFHLIRGDFSLLIMKSNLLISGMSSVCLETIAMGIPLIIIENVSGLRFNSIPEELSSKIWQNCKSPLELKKSINYFRSRTTDKINEDKKIGLNIKKNYFEKVTTNSISRFLETDKMKELN